MLITITNTSGGTLNDLDSYSAGSGPSAVLATGGAKKYPLPYPFDWIGALTNSSTKQLAMKPQDFYKRHVASTFSIADEWDILVQKGWVTFTIAAESTNREVQEKYLDAV